MLGNTEKAGIPLDRARLLVSGRDVLVTTHRNADPDALGSLLGMLEVCRKLGGRCSCYLPEGLSKASKNVLEVLGVTIECRDDPGDPGVLVVVDTSSPSQLGEAAALLGDRPLIVVDHHEVSGIPGASLAWISPFHPSCSEMVYLLVEESEARLEAWEASAMLAGILYDSKRFLLASPATLYAAYSLVSRGADYQLMVSALQRRSGVQDSERIARLKAASRLRLYRCGGLLIAVTHVSAYEASAARALLELGADIALVVSEHKGALRLVGRASRRAVEAGVSLGEMMERAASRLGGTGGGHAAAAGASGRGTLEEALENLMPVMSSYLEGICGGVTPLN